MNDFVIFTRTPKRRYAVTKFKCPKCNLVPYVMAIDIEMLQKIENRIRSNTFEEVKTAGAVAMDQPCPNCGHTLDIEIKEKEMCLNIGDD